MTTHVEHVVRGVALGMLTLGVKGVINERAKIETAFTFAWSRWPQPHAPRSLNGADGAAAFWASLTKPPIQGNRPPFLIKDGWLRPLPGPSGRAPEELLHEHTHYRGEAWDWRYLAQLFVLRFTVDDVLTFARAEREPRNPGKSMS